MKTRRIARVLLCVLILSLSLIACRTGLEEIELVGIPTTVYDSTSQEIDMRVVVEGARRQAQMLLPEAYLRSFVFTGRCQDLPELLGQVKLDFVQVQSGLLRQRVMIAFVSVDTIQQTLSVRVRDHSAYYPSTEHLSMQEVSSFQDVADVAYEHIEALRGSDCDATMTRLENSWLVVCTEPGSGVLGPRVCEFEIDASTGQIITTEP